MSLNPVVVKRALISVSDKQGIVDFAKCLHALEIEIISTGGTSQLLRSENIPVRDVSEITQFPEMMDGRVKTLHPKVHGGILGKRDAHLAIAEQYEIPWIDLVIVNLYPFANTIKKSNVDFSMAIENIDIGGPAMIRSAAKNMEWTSVVVDPLDYEWILAELKNQKSIGGSTRRALATKAFAHTAHYDGLIHQYLGSVDSRTQNLGSNINVPRLVRGIQGALLDPADKPRDVGRRGRDVEFGETLNENKFPDTLTLNLEKWADLRYGENPHQRASAYQFANTSEGVLAAQQHQGKQLSFNNIVDADAAMACVNEFSEPACVIVKHANPCGAAMADSVESAFEKALQADSQSAFGGIIAINQLCTKHLAELITPLFFEILIAPEYEKEALALLATKPNMRVLQLNPNRIRPPEFRFVEGGVLIQESDHLPIEMKNLQRVTHRSPTADEITTMLFAWRILKYIKSNAILIAKNQTTVGVGAGQVSRVDAVELAIKKAGVHLSGSILASDAFFPFRDSIDLMAAAGVRSIIQPGGSVRDAEIIAACNEHDIAMVFTNQRCFKH